MPRPRSRRPHPLRTVLTVLGVLAVVFTSLTSTASAATSPRALLTSMSMEAAKGSYVLETGSLQLFGGQVTVGVSPDRLSFSSDTADVDFTPRDGAPLERGSYADSAIRLTVDTSERACGDHHHTLVVNDIARDPAPVADDNTYALVSNVTAVRPHPDDLPHAVAQRRHPRALGEQRQRHPFSCLRPR